MKRLFLLPIFVFAASVFAGDGTVSLSPAVVMLRGEAGQSTTQTFVLRNGTSRTLSYDLEARDVTVANGARVQRAAGQIAGGIAATAVFSEKRVSIAAGERHAVTVTFTVPSSTAARAVMVLFRGADRFTTNQGSATVSLGSLLTFALSAGSELATGNLRVEPQTASSNLRVSQTCTNSGTEPMVAKGVLALIASDGRLAGKALMEPRRLLPGERLDFSAEYGAELQPGRYRVLVTYDYEGRALTQSGEVDIR